MTYERRYTEQEIAAIFRRATEDQEVVGAEQAHPDGLTLDELQEIGREAGIPLDLIARAASALDQSGRSADTEYLLGLPIRVSRTADLPMPLSDADWERLVIRLRETFDASGDLRRDGQLREWRNGNLAALVEPTEAGERIRLKSLNGNARNGLFVGLFAVGIALASIAVGVLSGKFGMNPETLTLAMMGAAGLAAVGFNAYRVPRWARVRGRQMDDVINHLLEWSPAERQPVVDATVAPSLLDPDEESEQAEGGRVSRTDRLRG